MRSRGIELWGKGQPRHRTSVANWNEPMRWDRLAAKNEEHCREAGLPYTRPRVFCGSMMDWLDDEVPIELLIDLLDLIFRCSNLDWQLLTKRPENFYKRLTRALAKMEGITDFDTLKEFSDTGEWLNEWIGGEVPSNVWIGTTVENQDMADKRIPELLRIPARVRFLSGEPLLSPIDLSGTDWVDCMGHPNIHWVICGGESGAHARPMHPDWARSLRDQCQAAGVPFFFKQWGEWEPVEHPQGIDFKILAMFEGTDPIPARLESEERCWDWIDNNTSSDRWMKRVGKKAAGRLLDGREWNEFPGVQS